MIKYAILACAAALLLGPSRSESADTDRPEPSAPVSPSFPGFGPEMMDQMSSMMDQQIKRMVKGVMEEQIKFLEQPENLARIARVTRQYYEELKNAGFSDEQALRIVTSTPLFPSGMSK